MAGIVSLGSINVDRTYEVSAGDLETLEERHEWFPDRGQTVRVDRAPAAVAGDPDRVRHGGKGANQAVAAARAGGQVAMLGRVGPDAPEYGVREDLAAAGVDTSQVGTAAAPTGTADVFVGPGGDNRIVVHPGANGTVDEAYVRARNDVVLAADCLLLQNEIPVDPVANLLGRLADEPSRPTVLLDPAPADGAEALLEHDTVDYLTPNEHEYAALEPVLDAFDGVVVRKQGADDVVVEGTDRFTVTPPAVNAVDTTGAGDVLSGFLAARLASGASLEDAVTTAVVAGSLSTRERGARGGIPTLETVRSFRADDSS